MGEIEIRSHETTTFDIILEGTRVFVGGFYDGVTDLTSRELELFLLHDDSRIVAEAYCDTDNEEYAEYLHALEEVNPDVPRKRTRWPAGRGCFRIAGLPPAVYEMRVYLDVRKRWYIKAEVDLREADLEFDPILVSTYDDFFRYRKFNLGALR